MVQLVLMLVLGKASILVDSFTGPCTFGETSLLKEVSRYITGNRGNSAGQGRAVVVTVITFLLWAFHDHVISVVMEGMISFKCYSTNLGVKVVLLFCELIAIIKL